MNSYYFMGIILKPKSVFCIAQVLLNIYNNGMSTVDVSVIEKNIACLILAAGAGQRFGSTKQIAKLNNKPLIRHIIDEANLLFKGSLFCMVGCNAESVKTVIADSCHIIDNKDWQQGMGSTLAYGIKHLLQNYNYEAVLVVLGDQYLITEKDLNKYIDKYNSQSIIATDYNNKAGVPALFPKHYFDALSKLKGDDGARFLLNANPDTMLLTIPNARYDIDTTEDLLAADNSAS
ncbi:MAG: nucleotidyltransferase family protein [Gammaproteobacteria bacterium]|nr:nucleotidyltransferase family protein [Gammaproteobacteria bacterium]